MSHPHRAVLASVCSLADHLDTALAACDDLLRGSGSKPDPHTALRLELTAITHILQARQDVGEMHLEDRDISRRLGSFVSATDPLENASPVVAVNGSAPPPSGSVLIGGRIPVVDMRLSLASLLAALANRYSLDPDDAPQSELPGADRRAEVWAHAHD